MIQKISDCSAYFAKDRKVYKFNNSLTHFRNNYKHFGGRTHFLRPSILELWWVKESTQADSHTYSYTGKNNT